MREEVREAASWGKSEKEHRSRRGRIRARKGASEEVGGKRVWELLTLRDYLSACSTTACSPFFPTIALSMLPLLHMILEGGLLV